MKLRKALDKARDERDSTVMTREPEARPVQDSLDKENSWSAPNYTESARHRINPDIVEKNRGVSIYPDSKEIEQYKILRTRIHQQAKNRKMNTVMITSANKNEGKTVTSINMGLTFA